MRMRLLTHFFQIGIGMCVAMEPEMSNCAEMSMISVSTSCAAHVDTSARYARTSTFSWRSVPFFPRLAITSASFLSTISYVTFSFGHFMTSSSFFSTWPFLPTTSKPSSPPPETPAAACCAFSASRRAFFSAFCAFSSSSLSLSLSLSSSELASSSVESGCSFARAMPAAIVSSSLACFFRRWRMELNALALVLDIFLIAGLFANVASIAASSVANARK